MEQQGKEAQILVPAATRATLLAGIAVGLLLLLIGSGAGSEWVVRIGAFVLSLLSFWGGLLLQKESVAIRATLLAVGGFVAVSAFLSAVGISSFLR